MSTITPDNRLRQIAILVSSVDSASARHLLLNLPSEIARKVRAMAAEMGPIPPEERKQLMLEIQKHQLRRPSTAKSTPGYASVPPHQHSETTETDAAAGAHEQDLPREGGNRFVELSEWNGPAWTRLSVEAMVRFVRHERPTVIAVILHQLAARQAAAVLQRLPRSVSREVLRCLGNLQEIDSEAMQAIDEHLSQRLSEYRHRIESEVENTRRINDLLSAAPPEFKQQWANWIRPDQFHFDESTPGANQEFSTNYNSSSAENFPSSNSQPDRSLDQYYRSASITTDDIFISSLAAAGNAVRSRDNPATSLPSADWNEQAPPVADGEAPTILPFQPPSRSNSDDLRQDAPPANPSTAATTLLPGGDFELVLTLSPELLAKLLSSLDSQTVLLSLAGASPQFMKRFNAMLEPADAKVLNARIQRIGPLQLRDVDEAQRRVLQAYRSLVESSSHRRAA